MSAVTEHNHGGNDNTRPLNRDADYGAGVAGGSFPIGGSISKQHETPTETGCFSCCRKANREAHEIVDFCEYRVIEPVGICCFTVVGGVVIGVCLVCAGACKCVACTASYINEKALKPVERGVGGGIVCVGEALSHLGEPNEETKAAWKAAELEKDAKPEEQGYCSWFWSGVFNCLCVPKANDHQEKPLHWNRDKGNLDKSQQPTTRQDCCLIRCCPCMGREPDHQEGALTDPHTKSGGKCCCPCAGREPDHQERSLGLGGDSRPASLTTGW